MQDDIEQPGVESDFGDAEESSPEQAALEKLHAWADSPNIAVAILHMDSRRYLEWTNKNGVVQKKPNCRVASAVWPREE